MKNLKFLAMMAFIISTIMPFISADPNLIVSTYTVPNPASDTGFKFFAAVKNTAGTGSQIYAQLTLPSDLNTNVLVPWVSSIGPYGDASFSWDITVNNIGNFNNLLLNTWVQDSLGNEILRTDIDNVSISVQDDDNIGVNLTDLNYPAIVNITDTINVQVHADDASKVKSVKLFYDYNNDGTFEGSVNMTRISGNSSSGVWDGTILPSNTKMKEAAFYILAEDNDNDRSNDSSITTSSVYTVTVFNNLPVIDGFEPSNTNLNVNEGNIIDFSQTSSDIDVIDVLTFKWLLNNAEQSTDQNWSFDTSTKSGDYVIKFIVNDGLNEASQEWNVHVNNAPNANAGNDQTANINNILILDGSNSQDLNGDTLTYLWEAVNGNNFTLINNTEAQALFSSEFEGTYVIQLTVSDGILQSSDNITVIIQIPQPNNPSSGGGSSGGGGGGDNDEEPIFEESVVPEIVVKPTNTEQPTSEPVSDIGAGDANLDSDNENQVTGAVTGLPSNAKIAGLVISVLLLTSIFLVIKFYFLKN